MREREGKKVRVPNDKGVRTLNGKMDLAFPLAVAVAEVVVGEEVEQDLPR